MVENYPALLVTKLYIPRLRSTHVSRDHLLAALDAGLECKLILIAAAAGFGKTTLLADWCSQRAENVCWLSLDEGDNDPARFLSYLIAAVQTQHPHIGQELLAALQSSQPPAIEHVLHSLINQLAAIPNRVILVLDDYHIIDNQTIHSALAFILDYLPPQMVLVLLTRTDPPLPLARLRARRELLELRAASLRFSVEEASQFLNQTMQLGLLSDSVSALDSHTEGWIAGLQLAAIAMQTLPVDQDLKNGKDGKQLFVQNFTGSNRFVLDYLIEEVLSRQPENVRRFLLQTSILHRLNGPLCSAITGEPEGQALIEYLERNNLFLVPLDQSRHWYRYHHLFGDLLQTRLLAEYPTTLNALRQRAAQWHAQNGFPEDAVVYALAAEDFEYAAYLISGPAVQVARRGEAMTLLDWYKAFPPDFVFDNPRLSLHFGLGFALNGRWDEAETLLNKIQQQAIETRPDDVLLLAYLVASYRHDAGQLAAIADEAANAHPDPTTKLVLALITSMSGNFRYACQLLAEAQDGSERQGEISQALTALFHQCRFRVFLGDLHQAYTLSQHALHRINEMGNTALPMAIFAHVSLGRIFIEWNDQDNATFHLAQAIRLAELTGFVTGIISSATMMLAEVKLAQGDTEGANQTAEAAITHAQRYDPPSEVTWLKTYQARIWLAQGNVAAAIDWMRSAQDQHPPSMFYPNTIQTVTHARTLLAQRKPESAIALLTRLPAESPDLLTVESLALLALARQAQGDSVHATLMLEQALTLAQAENRIRAFLDLGSPMVKLLTRFCETRPEHGFAHKLLSLLPTAPDATSPIELLSDRELEVLRLIVAGHSNEEIAQALTLALSTVKWYINTLYGKLHVKTRSQAIARTHELKLLAD